MKVRHLFTDMHGVRRQGMTGCSTLPKSPTDVVTHCQYVIQVPGVLFHPLAPTIVPQHTEEGRFVATWSIPDTQLKGNVNMLPALEKSKLPYQNPVGRNKLSFLTTVSSDELFTGEHCLYVE